MSRLEYLFHPLSRTDFLEKYLANEPVVRHGLGEKFSELRELPFLKSFESLLESWPTEVNSYLPGVADEVNSAKISISNARESYSKGMALFFDDPNNFDALISEWLMEIEVELGLSNLTYARSLIYALPKGAATAAHFDQNINFVLQISGTKKWWLAPNKEVENPMTRHTMGLEPDPELASYLDSELPETFPSDATEILMEPGSVLFLPRGHWHKTESLSDSMALNFTFSSPTWIDILTTALRGRLASSSKWRESANFVNDHNLQNHAVELFDQLLSELKADIPTWRATDILNATEGS